MAHGCTYCTDDFHCQKFTDERYTSWCYGKDYPCKDRRISNADRIRSMTDEELAFYIVNHPKWTDETACINWLREEVSTDG